jgi:hypothetical protein
MVYGSQLGKVMKNTVVTTLLLVCCVGCAGGGVTEPKPAIRQQDGGELCKQACDHMASLACEEGAPVPAPPDILACDSGCPELTSCDLDGGVAECVTCTWFCQYQHNNGVRWNTECLVGIQSCDEIESVCNY